MPYKAPEDREIIVERGKIYGKIPAPKNVIIDHEIPHIHIDRQIYNEGVIRADPSSYRNLNGYSTAELKIVDKINDLPSHNIITITRPATPTYYIQKLEVVRPKTASAKPSSGPYSFSGPWATTYRSSYTGRRPNY